MGVGGERNRIGILNRLLRSPADEDGVLEVVLLVLVSEQQMNF